MRIGFNFIKVGMGNNGGTRTLIRCAETLSSMGHQMFLINNSPIKYTWHDLDAKIQIVDSDKCNLDVEIATGVKSVSSVMNGSAPIKLCYVRGLEVWNCPESELLKIYKDIQCFCNSEWQHKYFLSKGIDMPIIYPGIDFNNYANVKTRREHKLGGLFHDRHKTKRNLDIINISKKSGLSLCLLNKDVKNVRHEGISNFYNNINIWVSSSELEGLHNPPMEASLCGCGLLFAKNERGGVSDYAIDGETALCYDPNDLTTAAKLARRLIEDTELREKLNNNMIKLLKSKIGERENNMQKLIDWINKL